MRIAIVTESFLPQVNGVSTAVRHLVDGLIESGHDVLIIAPAPGLKDYRGVTVVRTRSIGVPRTRSFPVGLPGPLVESTLAEFSPDLVHLVSPVLLGAVGMRAARRLNLPTVAEHSTDLGALARHHGLPSSVPVGSWVGRIHRAADLSLVPSSGALHQLTDHGVSGARVWGHGVDLDLFGPHLRNDALHAKWSRKGKADGDLVVVGYVGRLATEKQVRRLTEVAKVPGTRLVVIGEGPELPWLDRHLPKAKFTGHLSGHSLAQAMASLDVLVQPAENELFSHVVAEAQASGVAVVAPVASGTTDLVRHGRNGLLYDPTVGSSLRRLTALAVGDPVLRRQLAQRGLDSVSDLSWPSAVEELVQAHYATALDRGHRFTAA